jgi:hypothetical protein
MKLFKPLINRGNTDLRKFYFFTFILEIKKRKTKKNVFFGFSPL